MQSYLIPERNQPEGASWQEYDEEERDDEEEKTPPPLYICIHRNDAAHCDLWHQHPRGPTVYEYVTSMTPCRFCGHTGTLRKVN